MLGPPLVVLAALAGSPEAAATATPTQPRPATGLLGPGGYVLLSPAGVGFTGIPDAGTIAFIDGLDAGYYFTARRRFAAALGGFVEHQRVTFLSGEGRGSNVTVNNLRLGAVLRVGVRFPRLFAYGLGRIGSELSFNVELTDTDWNTGRITTTRYRVYPWPMGSVGAGVQGLLGRRYLLGGEGAGDIGGEAFLQFRFSLLLGLRF